MSPVRVAVIDPHELVVAGLAAMLSRCPGRARLVDPSHASGVDVVLYGVDGETGVGHDAQLHALLRTSSATVVAFGWTRESRTALLAAACGVHGFVSKQLPAEQLLERIELLHHTRGIDPRPDLPDDGQCHPGVEIAGLTRREIEVLSMIASGQTNIEIADDLCLSINSVKSYVRFAYRKIGASRRTQAVIWARQHGLGTAPSDGDELGMPTDASGADARNLERLAGSRSMRTSPPVIR